MNWIAFVFAQVNPQFYAFRWITLLLTQEFNFADSLRLWDSLLSNPDGPLVSVETTWTNMLVFLLLDPLVAQLIAV